MHSSKSNHEQKLVEFFEKEARALAGGPKNGMERPFPKRMAEWSAFTADELAWMKSWPLWIDIGGVSGGWLVVHAGFEPKPVSFTARLTTDPTEQLADRVTRVRWVHETTGEFVGMKHVPVLDDLSLVVKPHGNSSSERAMSPEAVAKREQRQRERTAKGLPPVAEQKRRPKKYVTTFEQPDNTVAWQKAWRGPQSVIYGHDAQRSGEPRVDHHGQYMCLGIDTGCCFGNSLTAAIFEDGRFWETVSVRAKEKYYKWPEDESSEK